MIECRAYLAIFGDILAVTTEGGCGNAVQRVEPGDAAEHSIMHRTVPTTKMYLAPNVSNAKVKKLSLRNFSNNIDMLWTLFLKPKKNAVST